MTINNSRSIVPLLGNPLPPSMALGPGYFGGIRTPCINELDSKVPKVPIRKESPRLPVMEGALDDSMSAVSNAFVIERNVDGSRLRESRNQSR